jgi:hypothetical protein
MRHLLTGVFALCFAFATTAFGQGLTTAAMNGLVTDKQGNSVAGATVTVLHEPSGTRATAVTRANGQYNVTGLRVGGPYTVSVSAKDLQAEPQKEVYLSLEQNAEISFQVSSDVVKLEAFTVSETKDTTFGVGRMGAGESFSDSQIATTATTRDNVQDIARLDSRIQLTSLDQGGQMSAQGQNFRLNSFLVDGVESNDPFGLKGDGMATLRSPVPLESLQAIDIQLTPFDVRHNNFTGVQLNAVTKSGGNEFHGSAKWETSDQDYRAKNPNPASIAFGTREPFKERTYNYSLSGPILRNRLFFYLNYDDFRREAASAGANFKYSNQSDIDAIIARAKAVGYDPGSLNATGANLSTQKTKLAKVDWNITDEHRISFTYRNNEGTSPVFAGLTSVFGQSFSNYWYDQPYKTTTYTVQTNSRWSPDFQTEASLTYTTWDASPINRGAPFPSVTINGLTGIRGDTGATITTGSVFMGTEFSRQLNQINTKEWQGKVAGDYSIGHHTITLGAESDQIKYFNAFAQAFYGSYTFANLAGWLAGTPSSYTDAKLNPGYTLDDAISKFKYTTYSGLLQDNWKPNANLTVLAGLRLDYPYVPEKPPYNAGFTPAFGFRNDTNNSGNWTIAPRVGFNYKITSDRKTEIRGGLGVFQSRTPAVWLSNAYSNAGVLGTVAVTTGAPAFSGDPKNQPTPAGTLPTPNINLIDPDFKSPTVWKGTLGVDHQLPFGGLVLSAEVNAIETQQALSIQYLNFLGANDGGPATLPDGRIRYAGAITNSSTGVNTVGRRRVAGFAEVFQLTNTTKGESKSLTLGLNRPLKNHWGAGISWTHGHATEVAPMTSSTAGSLFNLRIVYNPNEDVASTSNTDMQDKVVASFSLQFNLIPNARTTVTTTYIGTTGHAYSWAFTGDTNGDGTAANDLFYMPTQNDPKVRWTSATEQANFFAFTAANGLDKYQGSVVPRNAATSPWNNSLDLTIIQDIPGVWRLKPQFFIHCVDFGNMISKSWGLLDEVGFNYRRRVAGATYDRTANGGAGQYIYTFNANTYDTVPVVANDTQASRWQVKAGIKLSF